MSPQAKPIDYNYPAKALQPTFDIIEQAYIVYLELGWLYYSRQASALQKASIKPFYGVVLSQTRLRDIRELLHPASTSSCDIVEEHLSKGSYSCSYHSHGYHLAGEDPYS